jgi:hypothetical protein
VNHARSLLETSSYRIEIHHSDSSVKTADVNEVGIFTTVWTSYIVRWTIFGKNYEVRFELYAKLGLRTIYCIQKNYTRLTTSEADLSMLECMQLRLEAAVQNETCEWTGYPPNYAFSLFTLSKDGNRKEILNINWSLLFQAYPNE